MDSINKKKVIAVEGKDDVNFFNAFLKHLKINDFEIHEVRGKIKFQNKLPALVITPGFSDVEIFVVIRDADENAQASFESIRHILLKEKLQPPDRMNQFSTGNPRVGVYIMPGNSDKGILEDLCLKSVHKHPAMKCVKDFMNCVSSLEKKSRNESKAKAQAFLSAMPEIVNSVGVSALKGYWDFESSEFKDLKLFLDKLK